MSDLPGPPAEPDSLSAAQVLPSGISSLLRYLTESHSIRSSAVVMMVIKVGSILMGLMSSVLIARSLGPEGKGTYNLVFLLSTLAATVFTLGINNGGFFYVARKNLALSTAYANSLVVVAAGSLLAIAIWVSPLSEQLTNGGTSAQVAAVMVLLFPLTLHSFMTQPLLIGIERPILNYALPLLSQIATVALSIAVLLAGGSLHGLLWAAVAAYVVTQVVTVLVFRRDTKPILVRPDLAKLRESFQFGFPLWVAYLLSMLLQRIDQLMVAKQLGLASLGQYALAVAIGELLWTINLPVTTAMRHRVTSGTQAEAADLVGKAARLVILVLGAACLALALIAKWLIPFVYREEFAPAVPALVAYLPAVFFLAVGSVIGEDIGYQRKRTGVVMANHAIAVCCNVALLILLLPHLGIVGASLASVGAYFVLFLLNALWHAHLAQVRVLSVLVPRRADVRSLGDLAKDLLGKIGRKLRR